MSNQTPVSKPIYSLLPTDVEGFDSLAELAKDMRWSWNHAASDLGVPVAAPDHMAEVEALMDWIEERIGCRELAVVGHRVVHGGPKYSEPQRITAEMVEELLRLELF
jgi:acetate kinase